MGFNSTNVTSYINKFFDDPSHFKKSEQLLRDISEVANLAAISRVPFMLWLLCNIYLDFGDVERPETMTAIFALGLLHLTRRHKIIQCDDNENSLGDLSKALLDALVNLGLMSTTMLEEGKIVFSFDEMVDLVYFVNNGIIVLCFIKGEKVYYFRHLSLQEFFSAVYIKCQGLAIERFAENSHFKGVLHLVAGLEGAAMTSSNAPRYLKRFVKC